MWGHTFVYACLVVLFIIFLLDNCHSCYNNCGPWLCFCFAYLVNLQCPRRVSISVIRDHGAVILITLFKKCYQVAVPVVESSSFFFFLKVNCMKKVRRKLDRKTKLLNFKIILKR